MKKHSILLFSLFLLILSACFVAPKPQETLDEIVVLSLNDTHGAVSHLPKMKTVISEIGKKSKHRPVIISQGDSFQGSGYSNVSHGKIISDIFKTFPVDAMALGNHEFDWGREELINIIDYAPFPILAANVKTEDKELKKRFKPFVVLQRGENKIGVIGAIGPTTYTSILGKHVESMEFLDLKEVVRENAKMLRTKYSCNIVLLSVHEPLSEVKGKFASFDKITNFSGDERVDLILEGHSHKTYVGIKNKVPYIQSGCDGEYLGQVIITLKNKKITDFRYQNIKIKGSNTIESTEVLEIINKYKQKYGFFLEEIIFKANHELGRNAVLNVLFDYIVNKNLFDADVIICNSGMIRKRIAAGDVKYGYMYDVVPFENEFVFLEMTPEEYHNLVKQKAEHSANKVWYRPRFNEKPKIKIAIVDYLYYKPFFKQNLFPYFLFSSFNSHVLVIDALKDYFK